ncbi:MAG: hypothetical protein ACI9JN_001131 [Bacteroidia bacterium]|jgi:hypothetical protein
MFIKRLPVLFLLLSILQTNATTIDTIHVHTVNGFIESIGSNRVLILSADTFHLRQADSLQQVPLKAEGQASNMKLAPNVTYAAGPGITLNRIRNLQIIGTKTNKNHTVLATNDISDAILSFRNCDSITITNIEALHLPVAPSGCSGNVLSFTRCENTIIDDCDLKGSGAIAMHISGCTEMRVSNTLLGECSTCLLELGTSADITFINCSFYNTLCLGGYAIMVMNCKDVWFDNCVFRGLTKDTSSWHYNVDRDCLLCFYPVKPNSLYPQDQSSGFKLTNCTIKNNDQHGLTNWPEAVITDNCNITFTPRSKTD